MTLKKKKAIQINSDILDDLAQFWRVIFNFLIPLQDKKINKISRLLVLYTEI